MRKLFFETRPDQPTHERPAAFDDPLWQPQDAELMRMEFGRDVLRGRRMETLEYGYCDPEHPLQRYLERLARRLPQLKNCRVFVSPGNVTVNAAAIPDGTIFVSAGLLAKAKTEQAIYGVLLHEARHVHNRHSWLAYQASQAAAPDTIQSAAKRIGKEASAARAREYIADIEGAFFDMDKIGENPLGYKQFLEQLAGTRRSSGIVHGSMEERALTIAELLAAVHVPAVDQPLTPVDPAIAAWLKDAEHAHVFSACHTLLPDMPRQQQAAIVKRRLEEIANMPLCLLPTLLDRLWSEVRGIAGTRASHDGHLRCIKAASQRLAAACFSASEQKTSALGREAAVSAHTCRNYPFPEKHYQDRWHAIRGEFDFMALRQQEFEPFLVAWEALQVSKKPATLGLISLETRNSEEIFSFFVDRLGSVFPTEPATPSDLDHFWRLVKTMSQIMAARQRTSDQATDQKEQTRLQNQLFDVWAYHLLFPGHKKDELESLPVFLTQKDFQALKQRMFGHSDAPKPVSAQKPSQRKKRLVDDEGVPNDNLEQVRLKEFWRKTLAIILEDGRQRKAPAISQLVDKAYHRCLSFRTAQEVLLTMDALSALSHSAIEQSGYFLLLQRLVMEHPAFSDYSLLSKRLFLRIHAQSYSLRQALDYAEILLKVQMKSGEPDATTICGVTLSDLKFIVSAIQPAATDDEAIIDVHPDNYASALALSYMNLGDSAVGFFSHLMTAKQEIAVCLLQRARTISGLLASIAHLKQAGILTDDWTENPYLAPLQLMLAMAIKTKDWQALPLEDKWGIARWIRSPSLRAEYLDGIGDSPAFRQLSFKRQSDLVLPKIAGASVWSAGPRTLRYLSETRALQLEDSQRLKIMVEKYLRQVEAKGLFAHGVGLLLEQIALDPTATDCLEFVRACLVTRQTDAPLKEAVLKLLVRHAAILDFISKDEATELVRDTHFSLEEEVTEDVENEYAYQRALSRGSKLGYLAQSIVDELFFLSAAGKHLMLRNILGGKNGLLRKPESKARLLEILRETLIDPQGDPALVDIIEGVERAFAQDEDWEVLYLGLIGVLREHMLLQHPQAQRASWKKLPVVAQAEKQLAIRFDQAFSDDWTEPNKEQRRYPWRTPEAWNRYAEGRLLAALREQQPEALQGEKDAKQSPAAYVASVAMHAGAIAVRGMQNLGQVTVLEPQQEQQWAGIYDAVEGQSRLAFLAHLERIWPDFWEEYETAGAIIGGGSVFTVMVADRHDGRRDVIKLCNPNIDFQLAKARGLFSRAAQRLAVARGGGYELVPGMLEDISDWIQQERDFSHFLVRDRDFHADWNGFQLEDQSYRLCVPRSYGPARRDCVREEHVQATNLTQWQTLLDQGHDMRGITKLLATAYLGQLMRGQALSDIHPGNAAVTAQRELALFDRTLYLMLDDQDKALMTTLLTSTDGALRAQALEEYLVVKSGQEMTPEAVQAIQTAARSRDFKESQQLLLILRRAHIRPPLILMLVTKNLRVLDGMCKQAGWNDGLVAAVNA